MPQISKNSVISALNTIINNMEFVTLPALKYFRDEILHGATWTTTGMSANANSAMYKIALDLYNKMNTNLTKLNTDVKNILLSGDSWGA